MTTSSQANPGVSPASTAFNPLGLQGIEFVEFSSADPAALEALFTEFGFSKTDALSSRQVDLFRQGGIRLLLNRQADSHGAAFHKAHGPSIPAMGWRVKDAAAALKIAVERGATKAAKVDYTDENGAPLPAIEGIGGSLIYFIDRWQSDSLYGRMGFKPHAAPRVVPDKGFLAIDHLTNNVFQGTMEKWSNFYKQVFGFTEVRYFDIRGAKTGLVSYALRSPCGEFCIPINEGTEAKSQINEYLQEYRGPGIQHLAFTTSDIIKSLEALKKTTIETLDIDDEYYAEVFQRLPQVTEDRAALRRLNILVDGDAEGYLLQIFTRNIIGPIFIEIIQRKNHFAFGEGNFGALFRSLEKDQERRGVL
jgi:4-hydroxyphenylpyruvate dioxygenase